MWEGLALMASNGDGHIKTTGLLAITVWLCVRPCSTKNRKFPHPLAIRLGLESVCLHPVVQDTVVIILK